MVLMRRRQIVVADFALEKQNLGGYLVSLVRDRLGDGERHVLVLVVVPAPASVIIPFFSVMLGTVPESAYTSKPLPRFQLLCPTHLSTVHI